MLYRKSLKSAGGQNQQERLIKARERQATRQVYSYLNLQSDERLKDLGCSSEDFAALRAGEVRMPR